MKKFLYIVLLATLFVAVGCGGKSPVYDKACAKGRADAMEVLNAKPNSLDRENAVLHIRATEYRLRQAGDTVAARAYIDAAKAVFDSAALLHY